MNRKEVSRRRFVVGEIVDGLGVKMRRVLLLPCRRHEIEIVVGPRDHQDYPVAKLFMTFRKPWVIFLDAGGLNMLGELEFPPSTTVIREFLAPIPVRIGGVENG